MSWQPVLRVPVGACALKVPRLNWHLNNIVEMRSVHLISDFSVDFECILVMQQNSTQV